MAQGNSEVRYHVRFTLWQRYLHGVIFSTFMGLALTGLPLRFSSASWAERFAHAVGGFSAILFFHKFCALLLTIGFLIHVGDVVYRGIIKRDKGIFWGPDSLVPQPKDLKDLYAHVRWFLWLGTATASLIASLIGRNSIIGPFSGAWLSSGCRDMPCGSRRFLPNSCLALG